MTETKLDLADVPRATGVALYVPPGRRHYAPRRDPAAKGEDGVHRSLLAGGAGLVGQHRLAPGQRFQAGGSEDVGRPVRQRRFPDKEVRPHGLTSEEKRRRRDDPRGVMPRGARTVGICAHVPIGAIPLGKGSTRDSYTALCPKLGRRSGASAGPQSPTQRSALGQPGPLDSAHPAPDPPFRAPHGVRPRAPGKHSATSRTTAPPQYLSHVPRLSVRMPVLAPDRSPLSPCAHADPPQTVWSRRLGSAPARRVCGCSPRPAAGRALGPIAAAVTLPPLQVLPRRGPSRVRRGSAGAGSERGPGASQGISTSFELLA